MHVEGSMHDEDVVNTGCTGRLDTLQACYFVGLRIAVIPRDPFLKVLSERLIHFMM